MKRIFLFLAMCIATGTQAQIPQLLKDVNPGTADGAQNLSIVNGLLFFDGIDATHGKEPWWTDGTPAGTVMLKDLTPGVTSSYNARPFYFNNKYYLTGNDTASGGGLLVTDLTDTGTHLFKNFSAVVGLEASANKVFELDGKMFLTSQDSINQSRLYVSDGTVANTHLLKPGNFFVGNFFLVMNYQVYFSATPDVGTNLPYGLWHSDGSEPGTSKIMDFDGCARFTQLNSTQFIFNANKPTIFGNEPWISNGLPTSTVLLKDCQPWMTDSNPSDFTLWNGKIYFKADAAQYGINLWSTDGTETGTQLVAPDSLEGADEIASELNGNLIFVGENAASGQELWRTDGTQTGTTMIADINPGNNWSIVALYSIVVNDKMFFVANDGVHGMEIWETDGYTATMLHDLNPGAGNGFKANFRNIGNRVFFIGDDGNSGDEVFYFDVAPNSVSEVKTANKLNIYPNPTSGTVNISGDITGSVLNITDISGREIFHNNRITSNTYSLDISTYPTGIYIVEVNKNGIMTHEKLTKQ